MTGSQERRASRDRYHTPVQTCRRAESGGKSDSQCGTADGNDGAAAVGAKAAASARDETRGVEGELAHAIDDGCGGDIRAIPPDAHRNHCDVGRGQLLRAEEDAGRVGDNVAAASAFIIGRWPCDGRQLLWSCISHD